MTDSPSDQAHRLVLVRPRNLALRADRSLRELYRTRFEGRPPRVDRGEETVTVEYPRFALLDRTRAASTITLNASVPWRIEARGPVANLTADLGAVRLLGFEVVSGGAGEVMLALPSPEGEVSVRISGGAADVTIHRPVGAPVRFLVTGGASDLRLDDQRFRAVGGETLWQSPDFDEAAGRYDIQVRGGARAMTVDTLAAIVRPTGRSGRSVATVVFTDIVASTERARELGDRRWREVLDRHDEASARLVEREGGELVKTTGDGILALFEDPGPAIRGALALREELAASSIEIRAGLHTGEVEYRGEDVGGIAVHTAARILAAAAPGEVLVSRTIRDLVAGSDFTLEDRGVHPLKGVGDDWRLFAVA